MNNRFYKLILIVLLVGGISSCEDELDQIPFDSFGTDNAFVSAQDFENGIRGVYSALTLPGIYGSSDAGSMLSMPDVLSDNVTLSQDGRFTKRILHQWDYNPSQTVLGFYRNHYSLIYRANQLLFYAESFDGDNKANVVAEAKALRALAHFNLVQFYGKIPTQAGDANSSLGVAYVTEPDPNIEPARISVGETYNLIVQDLTEAAAGINETNPVGRMGSDAVNILLSRVYLYMGQWQNALNAANQVSLDIANRDEVVGVWEDANTAGLAFYIPNEPPILGNSIGVTWSQGSTSSFIPEYVASFELFNLYEDDDIRKEAYIIPASNGGSNYNGIKKLLGRNGAFNGQVDYKIFRAAEALLNRAEAQYRLGNQAAALNTLDQLREERYETPPSGESGSGILDAILLERRLEFAFEYQRFQDIKRRGLAVQRDNDGDLADGSGVPSTDLTLPAGSPLFQLPIAQETLDQNPNIVQNPGY